jgi:hypothetical protein
MDPYAAPQAATAHAERHPDRQAGSFTVLDWIGALFAGKAVIGLLAFWFVAGRSFESTFRDLGSAEQLPMLTRIVISSWFPTTVGLIAAVGLALGIRPGAALRRRRAWIVGAFVLGGAGLGLCVVGAYLPVFELAGKIKSE